MEFLTEPFTCVGCQAQFVVLFSQIPCQHLVCAECMKSEPNCVECNAKVLKRIENMASIFAHQLKASFITSRKEDHKPISLSLSERRMKQDKENPDASIRDISINLRERIPLTPLRTKTNLPILPIKCEDFELIKDITKEKDEKICTENWDIDKQTVISTIKPEINTFPIDKLRMLFKNPINTAPLENDFCGFCTKDSLYKEATPELDWDNNTEQIGSPYAKLIKEIFCQSDCDHFNVNKQKNVVDAQEIVCAVQEVTDLCETEHEDITPFKLSMKPLTHVEEFTEEYDLNVVKVYGQVSPAKEEELRDITGKEDNTNNYEEIFPSQGKNEIHTVTNEVIETDEEKIFKTEEDSNPSSKTSICSSRSLEDGNIITLTSDDERFFENENKDEQAHIVCLFSWNSFKSKDFSNAEVQTSTCIQSTGCQTEEYKGLDKDTQTTFVRSISCQTDEFEQKSLGCQTIEENQKSSTVTPTAEPFREVSPLTSTEIKNNASLVKAFEAKSLLKQAHENQYTFTARKQLDFQQAQTDDDIDVDILPATPIKIPPSKCPISIETSKSFGSELKSITKKLCLVTSGISKHDTVKVERFALQFNAVLSKNFVKEVTHLIVPKAHPSINYKTLKYIKAVAKKSLIVTLSWIDESLICGVVKPEESFIVQEPGPLSCLRPREMLFDNCAFCVSNKCLYPSLDEIKNLLLYCGGTVADSFDELQKLRMIKFYVYDEPTCSPEIIGTCKFLRILPVNNMWIFDCIASYQISNFEPSHLIEDKKLNDLAFSVISSLKMRTKL